MLFANGPCDEDIGKEAGVGFSHRYDNVVQFGAVSVDALVSLVSTTNLDSDDNLIDYLDRNSSTKPNALRTQIDIASGPETIDIGEAVIRVAFVQAGTRIPLTLQNAVISVKDVDDSQFVEFTGISSYKLTSDTALQVATNTTNPNLVTAGSTRFLEPNGIGTASTDERNWAEVSYSQLSVIDIKIGAYEAGDAFFDIDFTAAGFTATTNQVVLAAPSFTVTYNNNGSSETPPAATTGSGTASIASAPIRTGYTFLGWNTASDGIGLIIAAETNIALSANITLYAQWSNNSLPSTLDANGAQVPFANGPSNHSIGYCAGEDFSHRYNNVVQFGDVSIDALVSLESTTNLDSDDDYSNGVDDLIKYLDRTSSTRPNALRTQILVANNPLVRDTGEAVIRVAFVRAGTQNPVTLRNVGINVKDVDDRQYVEFAAISSYKLTSNTVLQVATHETDPNLVIAGSTRFYETNNIGVSDTDETNWVEVSYSQLSIIDIKIGSYETGEAWFDIDFRAAGFTAVTDQVQAAAPSYTVTYDNNGSSETPPAATTGSGTVTIASTPNRGGYTFTGWNTATDGTGLDIGAESNIALSANVTLYAQWSVTPTTTPASTSAPTTTSAPTATNTQAPSVTVSVTASLPATGSDTSQLVLVMMGLCLVGVGLASRKVRPRHDSNMRPMD